MSEKLWGGRFSENTVQIVEAFTASIDVDRRLYAYDIEGSIAHCKTLAKADIISDEDAAILIQGLNQIKHEIEQKIFQFEDGLEDIHTHIEARLAQLVGKASHKLHTARSRNDQVVLDMRLYLRDQTGGVLKGLIQFQKVIVDLAQTHQDVIMPGYTHLQRAQPVLLAHHLMAYYEMFSRDMERFQDGFKRINVMPLGTAALAGTTYPIDREYTAELLGFPKVSANSIDTVSDRDFMVEFLANASLCMVHLSRLSEEMILWSSSEFKFIELSDAFTTGSSIMPQKKNPDVAELVRGKTGGVLGDLIALLTVLKGLPLSYNRDMQEDKTHLFHAVDTLQNSIAVYTQMLPNITIKKEVMLQAASWGYLNATDLADYIVSKGIPFREAHACVGEAVTYALKQNKELHALSLVELQNFCVHIEADIYDLLTPERMVKRRRSLGGTAPERVAAAVEAAQKRLEQEILKYQTE